MNKFSKTFAVMLVFVLAIAALVACGVSNNPKKAQQTLEDKGYTVETIIGDNDLEAQDELDSMSDEMHISAGELVALLSAVKGDGDQTDDFLYIYYFKDGATANRFWDANQTELDQLKEEYKDFDNFRLAKKGSLIYFGTQQAISDVM